VFRQIIDNRLGMSRRKNNHRIQFFITFDVRLQRGIPYAIWSSSPVRLFQRCRSSKLSFGGSCTNSILFRDLSNRPWKVTAMFKRPL
jgi:hypothetical protein